MGELARFVAAEKGNIERSIRDLHDASARPEKSTIEYAAMATFLHSIYNGIESILRHLLKSRCVAIPKSESWHKDLIELSAEHRIIPKAVSDQLLRYLAFRHFFVHSYGFMLDPRELEPLIDGIDSLWSEFIEGVERFVEAAEAS